MTTRRNSATGLQQILWYTSYLFLRVLSGLINLLPAETAEAVARTIGRAIYYLLPGRRCVAMANLTIAFGDRVSVVEKKELTKRAFEHIAVNFMEVFRISRLLEGDVKETFTIKGLEHFDNALARKKGIIFVVSHIGSWEYLAFLFYLTGYPCAVVVKEVRNAYIFKWLNSMRRRATLNVIHKENTRSAIKAILCELSNNRIVAVLIDQWAGNDAPWVDFFGEAASTTAIPARLALKTGCALVPGACIRKASGKYEITIFPELPVSAKTEDLISVTKGLNHLLEKQIRENPEQWIWTHKRWKGKKIYADKR
ncbi:MAG: lysophospholipid acyltransferase family protein [Candidatus Omnitrophota bacterium]|nr:lysophospholipid acyltransferase family protein [Candidatus Omnitrophota bacterium]